MTRKQDNAKKVNWKAMVAEQEDFLRPLIREVLQEVMEADMDEALGAEKGERTESRVGYRSGYYNRTLVTRVGKLELRVPQDRTSGGVLKIRFAAAALRILGKR